MQYRRVQLWERLGGSARDVVEQDCACGGLSAARVYYWMIVYQAKSMGYRRVNRGSKVQMTSCKLLKYQ